MDYSDHLRRIKETQFQSSEHRRGRQRVVACVAPFSIEVNGCISSYPEFWWLLQRSSYGAEEW